MILSSSRTSPGISTWWFETATIGISSVRRLRSITACVLHIDSCSIPLSTKRPSDAIMVL